MPKNTDLVAIYIGFNDPRIHTRGTENVIRLQSLATKRSYYFFRGHKRSAFKWGRIVAISLPQNYIFAFYVINKLISRIQKSNNSVVIHSHNYILTIGIFLRRYLFTIHDSLSYLKKELGSKTTFIYRLIEHFVYLRAEKIHVISNFTAKQSLKYEKFLSKTELIYNSTNYFSDYSFNTTPRQNFLLVVRSIEERANLDLIIDYAFFLKEIKSEFCIKIAGKGPLLNHYKNVIKNKSLENIVFLGYVSDEQLDLLYKNSACVIMPALYGEGFGLPLIEAYSRGTPAVGSNICAIPEVIFSESLLFNNDVISLNTAIGCAIDISAEDYKKYFNNKFGAFNIIEKYKKLYESILPRGKQL